VEDLGVDEKLLFKCVLKKEVWREWTGFIWLRTGTIGEILYSRFYKMRCIS